jgi:LysR family hydrogen peroxide-inducible transcriptional activator
MVRKLEEELQVVLFERKANPIITTDCGKEIIRQARKVLYESQQLRELSGKVKANIRGQVKLGIIPTVASALLPKILKPITHKYPELQLDIREATTEDIVSQLKEGTLDLGILSTPLQMDDIEESILYYELLMVYGEKSPDRQYIMPDEIREHKVWMLEEGHCLRDQLIQLCSLREQKQLLENFAFAANSFETLLNLIDTFGGLTLIPELYYQTLSEERKAKVSFFKAPVPVREVSLVYFRPFAKHRIINALSREIAEIVNARLMSNDYPKHELEIAKI